ncbi:MAG TPA: class I SAM-dependent methyltransferase [Chloroflexota bacterium]|nr:class I SAM-dependent methyltransferase [Chloroflexota bacterium]
MAEYGASTYGERIANVYDAWVEPIVGATTEPAVGFLAELAGDGPALELGIGTGRVALPLAQRGVRVEGIDASPAMIERLRSKPGGADIPVRLGDFGAVDIEGSFRLVYVVFNTLFALLDQEAQVHCFGNVAERLTADGVFVIEAFVPDPTLYDRGQRISATRVEMDRVSFDAARLELATQRVTTQHVLIGREGITLFPVQLRYAWPSELDLMARLAGLTLRERFAGWSREPFTSTSSSHVSVYGRRAQV